MPDLQDPSRVLIGGMQTPEGLSAIQELVRAARCCWRCSSGVVGVVDGFGGPLCPGDVCRCFFGEPVTCRCWATEST